VNARIDRLRELLEEPLLVTDAVNVRYLTGFVSSNAAVLVEPDTVRLYTDFRYAEQARAVAGVEFEEIPRNVIAALAGRLEGRIGFEATALSYAAYETLAAGGRLELVPRRGLVQGLRATKDETELAAIREATGIANRAIARLADERFSGRTERELAWRLEQLVHDEGADAVAFRIIVAGGPNGANPHADPGTRELAAGDTVVIDFGARVAGYHSDCTRTFAVGAIDGRLREAYDVCLDAQLAALDGLRAGVGGREADAIARDRIEATRFAGAFGHGLGHGIGLEVHEAPALRPESQDTLAPGSVVTIEPGIYLPGEGGIRIEDLVVIGDDGIEIVTDFPKQLTLVE
jgi:Xaa-Pro aminopeptidase